MVALSRSWNVKVTVPTGTWTVDPAHSKVGFSVKHMGIATVRGVFGEFSGTLEVGDEITAAGSVTTASVDTNEQGRDDHLRSPDFFHAEEHPELTFTSTRIEAGSAAADRRVAASRRALAVMRVGFRLGLSCVATLRRRGGRWQALSNAASPHRSRAARDTIW